LSKYNRLLQIEEELGHEASFAAPFDRRGAVATARADP
jgi:enolase